jgi:UDP-glucose 4-epimerase
MKKVLITGGAGNVGSALAKRLTESGLYKVTVVDNLSTGNISNIAALPGERFEFVNADVNDINDISPIMSSRSFDFVFHYAAVVGVQRTLSNPVAVLRDIDGIKNILNLSKNTGVQRVFFSSSSEVYGEPVEFPQNEDTTPLNSRLPYAVVKNVGEAFLKSYYREYGLEYTIFRFFNTYGPNQSEDFVIPKFLRYAKEGIDIPIYGKGDQTRTFCHVRDNVDTVSRILIEGLCRCETINIGNDDEVSITQLAKLVIDLTGSTSKIIHKSPLKEGDMTRRLPDISKMRAILGRELVTIRQGIEEYISLRRDTQYLTVSAQ